jgi:hypothetical protein
MGKVTGSADLAAPFIDGNNTIIKCRMLRLEDGRLLAFNSSWRYVGIEECDTCNLRFKCWTAKEFGVRENGR